MKALLLIFLASLGHSTLLAQSAFQTHSFPGGISIEIPSNWKVLDPSVTRQLDTNTEAIAGVAQGNNEILLAANLYFGSTKPSATARLSVRRTPTLSEREFLTIPEASLQAQAANIRAIVERITKADGGSVVSYSERRERLAGHDALTTTYVTETNGTRIVNMLTIFFLGDRKIKLHVTYDKAVESNTHATVERIRNSLKI